MKKFSTTMLALLIAVLCLAQKKVDFSISLQQGKPLQYEMITKTDLEGPENIMMDMRMQMTFDPINITDTTINAKVNYSNFKMDMSAGMMTMSYDSSQEPQNEMTQALATSIAPLLENTLSLSMDKKGQISSIDFPNVPDQAFDKSTMLYLTTSFPDKTISIGETWTDIKTIGQLGVTMKITNTLMEKTADGYRISNTGILVDSNGNKIGSMNGFTLIDEKTHFTKASSTNSKMEIHGQTIVLSTEIKEIN